MRHTERVEVTFGQQWLDYSFDLDGTYHRKNLNMPMTVPVCKGGCNGFKKDSPITAMGFHQAFLTGQAVQDQGIPLTHVYVSPALCCVQTADAVLQGARADASVKSVFSHALSSVLLGIRPFLHIVRFIGLCDSPQCYALVMEFVGGGDLTKLLASSIPEVENWAVRLDVCCQVAMGMAHLHRNSPCVIHLDLKPGNVLIEKMAEKGKRPFLCKICDFGLSKMSGVSTLTAERDDGSSPAGTAAYLAPERYFAYGPGTKEQKMQIAKKSDVFSYGVLLWEILERRPPFDGLKKEAIQIHIKSGESLPVPEKKAGAPKGYVDLVDACSDHDPNICPGD